MKTPLFVPQHVYIDTAICLNLLSVLVTLQIIYFWFLSSWNWIQASTKFCSL